MQRHRAVRWLAPVGVLCVAGLAATGMFRANASSETLPTTTPARLIADMQSADVSGFSGTVVSQLSLGLPELPAVGNTGDGTSFTSLLSGSHTLQVWYGGADKQRVALLGSEDETDVFREGRQVWQWSSADHRAVHSVLPAGAAHADPIPSSPASLTPDQLAHRLLRNVDPSTKVAVEDDREVADRATYDLVLTPRTADTKVGSVRIAVDGQTKLPLGVQVYARGAKTAALDIAFTTIHFGHQAERNFEFTPPPNATVRQAKPGEPAAPSAATGTHPAPHTTGSGWTTVVGTTIGKSQAGKLTRGALGKALTPVSGAWGSGRLLDSALVSVLITDDGRMFAGAVEPAGLYTAAAK
jgi:hypothetical protein